MIQKLKTKYLLESVAFAFVFLVAASPVLASEITVKKVIDLVNREREERNIETLAKSDILSKVAERKAKDMIEKDYFAHTSPEGKTPWYWFGKEGYDYKYAGENLAINFFSAEKQMDAWMKSESHKKNILSENFSEIGVAVAAGKIDGKEAIVTVQEFGTPLVVPASAKKVEEKEISFSPETNLAEEPETLPVVLSEKQTIQKKESVPVERRKSFGKTEAVVGIIGNFSLFVAFLAVALAPMALLSRAFENMWIVWENREKRVRVHYVN